MSAPARKILIAMDGSKFANYAFEWYIKYFYKEKDDVLLAFVDEHAPPVATATFPSLMGHTPAAATGPVAQTSTTSTANRMSNEDGDITNITYQLQKKLLVAGIKGNVLRMAGVKAGEGIVTASEENKSDLIITGMHGIGVTKRTLMGSVSLYVVRNAHVPVLVVRQ